MIIVFFGLILISFGILSFYPPFVKKFAQINASMRGLQVKITPAYMMINKITGVIGIIIGISLIIFAFSNTFS